MKNTHIAAALLVVFAACTHPTEETSTNPNPSSTTQAAAQAPASPAAAAPPVNKGEPVEELPTEKFKDGAKAFAEVRESLLKSYYLEGLTEDDLYRAATAGMLEKVEPRMKKYNVLLSPREISELKNDLKGEVVGIGVQIKFDEVSGYTDVLGTLPGTPSEKAGLVAGDKIVTVNGKLYKGMHLGDVVADIRGKAGDPVTLSVLHGDKLVSMTIVRAAVNFDSVVHTMLPDSFGYIRIPSFTDRTPAAVQAGLTELEKGGAKALVVDLRHSPGGSFDRAMDTADLLLAKDTPIVTLKRRGQPEEKHLSKGKTVLGNVPMVVLVDGETASSGELLAGALREGRHAKLVGAKTHGKWSVQALDDLPNGYAAKYTVSLFRTPSGKSYEGTGMNPDVEISMDEATLGKANAAKPEERLTLDSQLRTAKELIK